MNLILRCNKFDLLFGTLQETNSRNEKELILACFKRENPELQEDLSYIFETLAAKHPIGWTFQARRADNTTPFATIKECIQACERLQPKTNVNTIELEKKIGWAGITIEAIVNRTLRLGIGNSQLDKSNITPMLAKKYEGQMLHNDVFVTEKLDGNRCIARWDGEKWCFTSRSGKPMRVNFDMTGMNTDLIYDGEVMSTQQTELSMRRYDHIMCDENFSSFCDTEEAQLLFNKTSGLINRHGQKSGLIYTVFDVVSDLQYHKRRDLLRYVDMSYTHDVRLLPILDTGTDRTEIDSLLDAVVRTGGEGVMLNVHNRGYDHKRTDALLKYKQVQFVDMRVLDVVYGLGKYEFMIGALNCYIKTDDGKEIICDVGTGLSDSQREQWAVDNSLIVGKIVQVGYHELTQDRAYIGTNVYSLRFPRLIKVRYDKDGTSEY